LLAFVCDAVGLAVLADDNLAAGVVLLRPWIGTDLAVPSHHALGRDDHAVTRPALDRLADQLFAVTHAIDGGGVDRVDTVVERGANGVERVAFFVAAPHPPADGPGAEDDGRD